MSLIQETIKANEDFGPGEFRVHVTGLVCPLVTEARLDELVASPGPFYVSARDVDAGHKQWSAYTFEKHGRPADGWRLLFGNNGLMVDFDKPSGECTAQVRRADSI